MALGSKTCFTQYDLERENAVDEAQMKILNEWVSTNK